MREGRLYLIWTETGPKLCRWCPPKGELTACLKSTETGEWFPVGPVVDVGPDQRPGPSDETSYVMNWNRPDSRVEFLQLLDGDKVLAIVERRDQGFMVKVFGLHPHIEGVGSLKEALVLAVRAVSTGELIYPV